MKCASFADGAKLSFEERPSPSPSPKQVRLRVRACGLCHSDVFTQMNSSEAHHPIPGHEVIGIIEDVGKEVKGFKIGDRVGVGWFGGSCHSCQVCVRANCWVSCKSVTSMGDSMDGGYATHMLANEDALARIPDGMSDEDAAPLLCAGLTTFNALRHTSAGPGDLVAVLGVGGLGHLAIQFAAKMGFRVAAVSRGSDKKDLAIKLGTSYYIDSSQEKPVEALKNLGGAKVILDTTGNSKLVSDMPAALAFDGELVVTSIMVEPLTIHPLSMLMKRAKLVVWPSGDSRDTQDTLQFALQTGVKPLNEIYPFAQIQAAYDRMASTKALFRVVVKMD